jgi:copper chaperone CopZ
MEKKVFDVPAMYGDHHVTELRSILLRTPGVMDVYASSAFHVVEVIFDETQTNAEQLAAKLDQAGYSGDLLFPVEFGVTQSETNTGNGGKKPFFRHTEVFENSHQVVSFSQNVIHSGSGLWPCPGFDRVKKMED